MEIPLSGTAPSPLLDGLAQLVFSANSGLGAQLFVSQGGTIVADVAIGTTVGGPLTPDHVHKVWCATKPILAHLAVESLAARSIDPSREQLTASEHGPTIAEALTHRAGLLRPSLFEVLLSSIAARSGIDASLASSPGWDPAVDAGYSEYATWRLLVDYLGKNSAAGTYDLIRSVLIRAGVADDVLLWLDRDIFLKERHRIGVYFSMDVAPRLPAPWLADRTYFWCNENTSPHLGGYASARGLGRWYEFVLRSDAALPTSETDSRYDQTLKRTCAFAGGHMVKLWEHDFGNVVGRRAFGMSGWGGNSVVFADPDAELAAAFFTNGILTPDAARTWRRDMTHLVYNHVESTPR